MPRSRGHPKQRSNLRWHPLGTPQVPAVIMQGQEEEKRRKRGKIEGRRANASSCAEQKQAPMKGACD
ncbi:hypothetical protein A6033_06380 [Aeromonas veronii]|nr:hypothetical protein A6033_06380 [Aeromonas veronii]